MCSPASGGPPHALVGAVIIIIIVSVEAPVHLESVLEKTSYIYFIGCVIGAESCPELVSLISRTYKEELSGIYGGGEFVRHEADEECYLTFHSTLYFCVCLSAYDMENHDA